jgi:hypothetical protein
MPPEQRAVLDRRGRVAGQVLVGPWFLLVPLHVADELGPPELTLLDSQGGVERVYLREALVSDPAWDLILFRTGDGERPDWSVAWGRAEAGDAVEVRAIGLGREDEAADGFLRQRSAVREVVEVERHGYRKASGGTAVARNVGAILLADSFSPGWSGAPVFSRRTGELLGFVHGNAGANAGAAVCLVGSDDSGLWRLLQSDARCGDAFQTS